VSATSNTTPADAPTLSPHSSPASLLFGDLEHELERTRRTLERYPEGRDAWRPHEKSTPLGRIAVHVATLPTFAKTVLESEELDFAQQPWVPRSFRTASDLVAIFDESVREMWPAVNAADFDVLNGSWTMRIGPQVIATGRRAALIRELMINHIVHHRAQMGVYYRLLGVPVPSIYGPTADEPM
jgi:uncharacterized damage-inducible protein DinB